MTAGGEGRQAGQQLLPPLVLCFLGSLNNSSSGYYTEAEVEGDLQMLWPAIQADPPHMPGRGKALMSMHQMVIVEIHAVWLACKATGP